MARDASLMFVLFALMLFVGCGGHDDHGHDHGESTPQSDFASVSKAVCTLSPTTGTALVGVTGTVTFTQTKNGLLVQAEVTGLTPNAKHGFHIHEWGDIGDADAGAATGGHYDPRGLGIHALPKSHSHGDITHAMTGGHAGALGNIETDAEGKGTYSQTFKNISITGINPVLGRAVVIRLGEDDGTPPAGNAGPPVAQGVIGVADPEP